MSRKITGATDTAKAQILRQLDENRHQKELEVSGGTLVDQASDDYGM